MCGIAGIASFNITPEARLLKDLVKGIEHRGPDDQGVFFSSNSRCALGHARLAILDLSPAGHQPMKDEATGNAIVFNGEIYNFASLRKDCETNGYTFKSHSDTEIILALYHQHGTDCLQFLRGMFAFAIWDEKRQRLFFARDRVGKKPFHYALSSKGLTFCSEIDPLARHPWTDNGLDIQAVDFFLHLQYIPTPHSIYRGIRKLPPAHYGLFSADGFSIKPYWQIDFQNKLNITESEALDAFEEKLGESVKLRMVADVPVGALLSGGVDSSVIVALMTKFAANQIHTYSVGFDQKQFDESSYALEAAKICNSQHRRIELSSPNTHLLPTLVKRYGEPYGDSSALPSSAVCAEAHQEVKVVLNGDGGDELLGGYPRYALPTAPIRLATWLRHHYSSPFIDPTKALAAHHLPFPFKKLTRLSLKYLLLPDASPLTMYSSCFGDNERNLLLSDKMLSNNLPQWRADFYNKARSLTNNPIDCMLWLDNQIYLPDDLLIKMDIASMHCGLEARSPFLDHELLEFAARLPVNVKVKKSTGKYLLKKLAERYFPKEFVYRRKMGFGIPLAIWLRGPLRPILEDILRDPFCMSPLNITVVEQCRQRFLEHNTNEETRIWLLFMYGLWRRYGAPTSS